MKLLEARRIAETWREFMRPYCERVEIAGSIRRLKNDVKDIEIVAVPKWESQWEQNDVSALPGIGMVGPVEKRVNLLHEALVRESSIGSLVFIKPGTNEVVPWQIKPDGKYWRALVFWTNPAIKMDIFLAANDNFGLIYLIRTGPADFSQTVVTIAKKIGRSVSGGYVTRLTVLDTPDGRSDHATQVRVPTPSEDDVFRSLGLPWVAPNERSADALARAILKASGVIVREGR